MIKIEKNLRKMSDEDIEIIALRFAKEKYLLTNRNVNCFIDGLKMARQWLIENLPQFLEEEGLFMQNEYSRSRINALANSGCPVMSTHHIEFEAAKEVGALLLEASRLMTDYNVL